MQEKPPTKNPNPLLDAALFYAEKGYKVFPCVPGGKIPLTKHGFHDATVSADIIAKWWNESPDANVALATEGLVVLDIDGSENKWLHDLGDEKRDDLNYGAVTQTPRGGYHFFFKLPKGGSKWRNTTGKIAEKVDTRAKGGYVVIPPSRIGDKKYHWVESHTKIERGPLALDTPPMWLQKLLDQNEPLYPKESEGMLGSDNIPSGQRNSTITRFAGGMRRMGMSFEEILEAIKKINGSRCNPPLKDGEITKIAKSVSRYEPDQITVALIEDHWGQMAQAADPAKKTDDPGIIDESMLYVPGFINEVMDISLSCSPYPNKVLAFCGALALQSFLAGRKLKDPEGNRTNLYVLGLAHSGEGKDGPRRVNAAIMHKVGLIDSLGEQFASGEGIQDSLYVKPVMLFQTDEMDNLLLAIKHANDNRFDNIMAQLMKLYTSSASIYPMRRKAGRENAGFINQPSLSLFGTAIPSNYYSALSERTLSNGFFARTLIFESEGRSAGQSASDPIITKSVELKAKKWAEMQFGSGDLSDRNPTPKEIPRSKEADEMIMTWRAKFDAEYDKCRRMDNHVGTAIWARASEQACKLSLIYAISEDQEGAQISAEGVQWANKLLSHQIRRMLFMAENYASDNPFDAECLKVIRIVRGAGGQISHSKLLRRSKRKSRDFNEMVQTLIMRGDLVQHQETTATKPKILYKLPK